MKAQLIRDGALYAVVGVSLALALFGPTYEQGPEAEFEFDSASSEWLTAGWSLPERNGAQTYTWAMGRRAALRLPIDGRRERVIRLRCWPINVAEEPLFLTLTLNGHELDSLELARSEQTHAVVAPARTFAPPGQPNQLVLGFTYSLTPRGGDAEQRPLAVAFDWIRVQP